MDDFQTACTHVRGPLGIEEDIKARLNELVFVSNHNASTAAAEEFENFHKVKHVRADNNGLAVSRRFQYVMAADTG